MRAVKSVSIDSERRVIITYLDGSTETLYPNCIWCDSEALRQLIKDLLEDKADAITQTIENITVATFADGADEGLIKKLLVSIDPIQEGTGDPSPENVRPISGRTGLTVYRSGSDTSNPTSFPVSWESEVGVVYGGRLDVVSGELTVRTFGYTFDGSETIIAPVREDLAMIRFPDVSFSSWVYTSLKGSSHFKNTSLGGWNSVNQNEWLAAGTNYFGFGGYTKEQFKSYASDQYANGTPITCYMGLSTPIEIQLNPQEITTLLGDNNIWADSGNILELEYTADTKLYIGEQQSGTSGTLGSGRQTIVNPDLQPVSEKTWEDVSEAYKEEVTDERGEE